MCKLLLQAQRWNGDLPATHHDDMIFHDVPTQELHMKTDLLLILTKMVEGTFINA